MKGEASGERSARQDAIRGALGLLGEEGEGGQPDPLIKLERARFHFSPSLREGKPLAPRGAVKCKGHCWPRMRVGGGSPGGGMEGGRAEAYLSPLRDVNSNPGWGKPPVDSLTIRAPESRGGWRSAPERPGGTYGWAWWRWWACLGISFLF